MWNSETSIRIKTLFHEWDCCRLSEADLITEIRELGFHVPQTLMNVLDHHKLTRNLSYIDFVKALTHDDTMATSASVRTLSDSHVTPKLLNAVIFKDIPVLSSAKAPYGTDNNLYIRDRTSQSGLDSLSAAVIDSTAHTPRRALGTVPGAKDIFKESENTVTSECKHPSAYHTLINVNPITGDGYAPLSQATSQVFDPRTPNAITGEGVDEGFNTGKIVLSSKRHYEHKSAYKISDWATNTHVHHQQKNARTGPTSDVISHNPDRVPLPHRPIMKAGSAKRPDICPFATDADDLDDMRRRILMNPLGKITAPEPLPGVGTLQ